MLSNESGCGDREKNPSLMRSNNDQGRRSKEVSTKVGETLKEHPQRKNLRVAVNLWTIEALMNKEIPHRKGDQKSQRSNINIETRKRKKKHLRYSSSPSPSSSSNDGSDESKYRNSEGKKSTDSRFRVVSEEVQYNYSLNLDMAQYANINFDTYIKEGDLLKAILIKIPVKTLDDFVKDIFKDKKKQKNLNFDNVLEKIQGRNRSVRVHYWKFGLQLSQPDYLRRIQWRLT